MPLFAVAAISANFDELPDRVIGFDVKPKQSSKFVGVALISTFPVRAVQSENVKPIFVTLLGMSGATVRAVQSINVLPIFVTLVGMTGAVESEVQP